MYIVTVPIVTTKKFRKNNDSTVFACRNFVNSTILVVICHIFPRFDPSFWGVPKTPLMVTGDRKERPRRATGGRSGDGAGEGVWAARTVVGS